MEFIFPVVVLICAWYVLKAWWSLFKNTERTREEILEETSEKVRKKAREIKVIIRRAANEAGEESVDDFIKELSRYETSKSSSEICRQAESWSRSASEVQKETTSRSQERDS